MSEGVERPEDLVERLGRQRVLPLIDTDAPEMMPALGEALLGAALPLIEVTLRRPRSLIALRRLAEDDRLIVGAGTVMDAKTADAAVEAGARFLVSPGFSSVVGEAASRLGVTLVPGVATATEMMAARAAGFRLLKFFPAESNGGAAALRALSAVDPAVRWVPTGGIDETTAADYLRHDAVVAVGGSWMTPHRLVDRGDMAEVRRLLEGARNTL